MKVLKLTLAIAAVGLALTARDQTAKQHTGEDRMQGKKMITRITTFHESPAKFEW